MHRLIIRHVNGEVAAPAQFQAISPQDGRMTDSVLIPSPIGYPVEGRPHSDLQSELRWYLEEFLGYPFSPETEHAERVQKSLKAWGQAAFNALFDNRRGGAIFDDARKEGFENLQIEIASDNPQVLGWPWEALQDPQSGPLAQICQIERRLNTVLKPDQQRHAWPDGRVNILLVTARPYPGDVNYRSISRPLVEIIDRQKLPAELTVLRPPTMDNLRDHLHARPNHYHIVHFDGHGSYSEAHAKSSDPHALRRPEGRLIFENAQGNPDPITAEQLSVLLREHHIPAVVLNACQSAMVDGRVDDPFASVAAALLKSGIRSVVAMAYSLYVSGAQVFLPAFYRELFHSGGVAQAARAGRQGMLQKRDRVCARGLFPLDDWLIPVVYQNEPFDFTFATRAEKAPTAEAPELPPEARDTENPYGFVGRDGAVLALERAMHRPPAGLLIQGLGGVGKTTLARGFLQWLRDTGGLVHAPFWFTFQEIRSAEYLFNRMGEALFGPQFGAAETEQKLDRLLQRFRENPFVIIWDNFETVRGIPGTSVTASLSDEDQVLLKSFLSKLRGGKTKVIITSRSDEDWLGLTNCFAIPIGGLQGEERWDFCTVILNELGLTIDRKDADLIKLMNLLNGHPLSMRVVIPHLARKAASDLIIALQSNLADLGTSGDPAQDKLFAALRFAEQTLSTDLQPILIPLALHERFVDADYLEEMAKQIVPSLSRSQIDHGLAALTSSGVLNDHGESIFEIHPALTGFLQARRSAKNPKANHESWRRAFVDITGTLADTFARCPLHVQRDPFFYHEANFRIALQEADRLGMKDASACLTLALATFAQNSRNFREATHFYDRLAKIHEMNTDRNGQATVYHQQGIVAQYLGNLDGGEQWHLKSLAISESIGNEHSAARSYHQLGSIAQGRGEFDAALEWCFKSLDISEKLEDERMQAFTYGQVGNICQDMGKLDMAEVFYLRSLAISDKLADQQCLARTYHQLGNVVEGRGDFDAAMDWYSKSLTISKRLRDENGLAITYSQLGTIQMRQHNLDAAVDWYLKAIEIFERQKNDHEAALIYHQLGMVAQRRSDLNAAVDWYLKAIEILERQKNDREAALTYYQLGSAQERTDIDAAERWYHKALTIFQRSQDLHRKSIVLARLERLRGETEGQG